MKQLLIIVFFLCTVSTINAQYRFKTKRDPSRYSEKNVDVKIFRTFNNIHSKFVHTLINITNISLTPVSIGAPAGLYITSRINKNHYDESSAVLLGLAEMTNGVVTFGIKQIFKRDRPYRKLNGVYLSDTSAVSGTFSFPSGHASGAFVIATSLTLRYPDKPLLIAGLFTYATIVSLGRMYWGVHYPSDVLTGMLVGAGSAALIYSLRVPIIKAKNKFFNQSERNDNLQTSSISTPVFLISLAATDIVNFYFTSSNNRILNQSKINFSSTSSLNYLNYTLSF
ncbi:MAG: phosphatase PAP2 family protein [Ignavibacteria bacterium]